ncbi:hypothetical protein GCM10025857_30230 [Alicyclobacillus contaminans]|nr:hypothetical protein GCM10025857_30230 [Alicyclobacillus contaminans]
MGSDRCDWGRFWDVESFILHPNELKNQGTEEAIVIRKVPESLLAKTQVRSAAANQVSESAEVP